MNKNTVQPELWRKRKTYYLEVIKSPWYQMLIKLQNLISRETMNFYEKKGLITFHLPITTGSISSPMGRGSDSTPVKVKLCGVDTYLADSMQFMLEYGCRIHKEGVYYIMPSFRGEMADERHLCQFYHSEAEIPGDLNDIIKISTEYIKYLSKKIVKNMGHELKVFIGDIDHVLKVANHKGFFKRITFNEAEEKFIDLRFKLF